MDNYYNSVTLSNVLLNKQTQVTGTLRNNRKGNPKEVVNKKLKKGEHVWKRRGLVYVSKWKDKSTEDNNKSSFSSLILSSKCILLSFLLLLLTLVSSFLLDISFTALYNFNAQACMCLQMLIFIIISVQVNVKVYTQILHTGHFKQEL
jgi:hypothetical protein